MKTPIQLFWWEPGGSRGGEAVRIIWRVPRDVKLLDENKAFQLQTECLQNVTIYQSRAAKTTFLASAVTSSFIKTKAGVIAMYEHITGNRLPHDAGKSCVAVRMAQMALATQDFDIVQDLRSLNGRPKSPDFDLFWKEMNTLMIENADARVDDRRHGAPCIDMNTTCNIHVSVSPAYPPALSQLCMGV